MKYLIPLVLAFSLVTVHAEEQTVTESELQPAPATSSADELAMKLSNPVSSLISVPLQNNFDFGYDNDGWQYKLNVQPVIPISLSDDWNLITRVIVPFIHQQDVVGNSTQTGLSDTLMSLFLSPAEPVNGITWGVGPALLFPTATDDLLGSEKWGAGPTFVILRQDGPWTYGMLANHVWSYAGDSGRADVSSSFLQPFLTWGGLGSGQTITINSESSYNWETEDWTIPINLLYSKVFSVGSQQMQFQIGGRVYADAPSGGSEWGIRAGLVFLFPK